MCGLLKVSLCLFILVLLEGMTEAFKPRTLSAVPGNTSLPALPSTTLPQILNTALPAGLSAAGILANFPANLTGDLTGIELPNATELRLIEQFVLNRTRPVVKSFIDGTNTTIDCVPIQSQIALSNPLLRNHTVRTAPPNAPTPSNTTLNSSLKSNQANPFLANGTRQHVIFPAANATSVSGPGLNISGGCPSLTVPVPRLTVADVARFGSLQAFLTSRPKKGRPPTPNKTAAAPSDDLDDSIGHEYALLSTPPPPPGSDRNGPYYGIQTQFSVWQPYVAFDQTPNATNSEEFSLSQLWLTGGPDGPALQTVEAGWQVDPVAYGDTKPHFFIFSTTAGYLDQSACYAGRADCAAGSEFDHFVQVSNSVYPTIALQASVVNDTVAMYELLVYHSQNSPGGSGSAADYAWWVVLNGEPVGYYPAIFYTTEIYDSADSLAVGGEIVNTAARIPGGPPPALPHTKTQMGSGVLSTQYASPSTVAFHYDLQYVDSNLQLQPLDARMSVSDLDPIYYKPACYSALWEAPSDGGNGTVVGPMIFYFGGPGYSAQCTT